MAPPGAANQVAPEAHIRTPCRPLSALQLADPQRLRQIRHALDAGVWVPADQRDRLERLCRYALRPTVAQDRLRLTAEGQVVLQLRHPWSDGTTHLLFDPLELLGRLAVLTLRQAQGHPEQRRGMIPRPRINLILYHGVLGPRAAWSFDLAQDRPEQGRGMAGASD